MKVLMQGRYGLMETYGGDRIQVEKTAYELRKLGIDVDISSSIKADVREYDLVHIFQLDWTAETHLMAINAKRYKKPLVFSPIHHNVSEVKRFDDEYVFDFRKLSKILFKEQHQRDTFKNIYRTILKPKNIYPTLYSLIFGLKNMHRKTLTISDVILVQTELEAKDLKDTYKVDFKWSKVPNGVGEHFLTLEKFYENPLPFDNYIFSVGRIEPRKNQLNIIGAVKQLREDLAQDIKLVFVGKQNHRNHFEYTRMFKKALAENSWITYIEFVPNSNIPVYFKFAKVCVSASWFETTGLTLLEALYCGTNAVASSPRAREILGDYISYCDPGKVDTIKDAIKKEFLAPRPEINESMKKKYTWENAAKKTYKVYRDLLNSYNQK